MRAEWRSADRLTSTSDCLQSPCVASTRPSAGEWPKWYVVWVATGQEAALLERIRRTAGIDEALCPVMTLWQRKQGSWALKERTVFPGYVFIRCRMTSTTYCAIRDLPGVLGWLGRDSLWPAAVRQEEMDVVLALYRGVDPGEVLTDLRTDRRQRRGYGSLTLHGKAYRIPYNVHTDDDNQAEEPVGDASPQERRS